METDQCAPAGIGSRDYSTSCVVQMHTGTRTGLHSLADRILPVQAYSEIIYDPSTKLSRVSFCS